MTAKGPLTSAGLRAKRATITVGPTSSISGPLAPLLVDPSAIAHRLDNQPILIFDGLFDLPDAGLNEGSKREDNASVATDEQGATFIDKFVFGFDDSETSTKESLFIIGGLIVLGVVAFNVKRFKG